MPTKKEIIEKVYYGPDGFGSIKEILKDAKKFDDNNIRRCSGMEIQTRCFSKTEASWKQ